MTRKLRRIPESCLLFGYCGNLNTGSDVRMLTIVDDLRAVFGPATRVTIVSQNRDRTSRIIAEDERTRIVEIPFGEPILFGNRVQRLVSRHDATFLIEGSALQQNFSAWLLYAYLWVGFYASLVGRPCIAYAVDVGDLTPFNRYLTTRVCRRLDLIITRTERARDRLQAMGVPGPIRANTDTAFQYLIDEASGVPVSRDRPLVGMAPIEFHHWPVRLRPFGSRADRLRWPYHFTWTKERRRQSEAMIQRFVVLIQDCLEARGLEVALIGMEAIDRKVCEQIRDALPAGLRDRVALVTSHDHPPWEVVRFLRGLDFLVTSRYHASVLSIGAGVPQMAVAHDERITSIYRELGLADRFLLPHDAPDLEERMLETLGRLQASAPELRRAILARNRGDFLPRCAQNRADLSHWLAERLEGGGTPAREG